MQVAAVGLTPSDDDDDDDDDDDTTLSQDIPSVDVCQDTLNDQSHGEGGGRRGQTTKCFTMDDLQALQTGENPIPSFAFSAILLAFFF